ncbi:MAG: PQQ-dependent sugar dehydrogenase, partial [Shewanella sp.]
MKTNNYNYLKKFSAYALLGLGALAVQPAFGASQSIMITVAKGFGLSLYASDLGDAKQLAIGANGTLFVGSQKSGTVHAVVDSDSDGQVDKRYVIAKGLDDPDAIAFYGSDLFVATGSRILRFVDIEQRLRRPTRPKEIYSDLPDTDKKSPRAMGFGPD